MKLAGMVKAYPQIVVASSEDEGGPFPHGSPHKYMYMHSTDATRLMHSEQHNGVFSPRENLVQLPLAQTGCLIWHNLNRHVACIVYYLKPHDQLSSAQSFDYDDVLFFVDGSPSIPSRSPPSTWHTHTAHKCLPHRRHSNPPLPPHSPRHISDPQISSVSPRVKPSLILYTGSHSGRCMSHRVRNVHGGTTILMFTRGPSLLFDLEMVAARVPGLCAASSPSRSGGKRGHLVSRLATTWAVTHVAFSFSLPTQPYGGAERRQSKQTSMRKERPRGVYAGR